MPTKKKTLICKFTLLTLLTLGACVLYLTYHTYGNWAFALPLRGKKLLAFVLVGLATGISTISFQTLTKNHFLTPNILGLDALYVFIQTILFFLVGGQTMLAQQNLRLFLLNILLTVGVSSWLILTMLRKAANNLFLLLMTGMILGTLFRSISTFLQVVMDPNEYDLLQGKLFASFGNVQSNHLLVAWVLVLLSAALLWRKIPELDVLHLGREQAISLGVPVARLQRTVFLLISLLVGVATALVGPVTFLGFIVANISYQFFATYRHRILFAGASLLGIFLLVMGQFLVEQVFQLNATLSTVIEFSGGIYFVLKIIRERKQQA